MAAALRVTPISHDCSDLDLVAAVRRGSDTAFEELYSRYSDRIGAYVRGMVADHGRAEDVTQEIFIAALRRMRETDRTIVFKPWIYEIAKNACIDSFRRTRRAQEVSLDADDGLSSADRGRLTVVTTPDVALDSKQALHDLRGAFGGLSDSHHEILVLRELEGRSYNDIGERLGMTRPVVESTLFRARRRLAEEYNELASGRRCEFVRTMVDSGPHYSLGIRDRRRIARHLEHCQRCRAHAHAAGFDQSTLNMPSVAAKIAALVPIPLLRARWDTVESFGSHRGRPSLLLRSVHALARSSDQIVGASAGGGRGAATAAAIVLAGVSGGIVTAASSQPASSSHRMGIHAFASDGGARPTAKVHGSAPRTATAQARSLSAEKSSVASGRAVASSGLFSRSGAGTSAAGRGAAGAKVPAGTKVPAGSSPKTPAPAVSGEPSSAGGRESPAGGARAGGAGDGTGAGTGGSAGSTGAGSPPTGTVTAPVGPMPTPTLPTGVLSTTLGGLTGGGSHPPPVIGSGTGSGSAGSLTGTLSGIAGLLGHS
ncbi:MAG TPA: sigma-70 family RNA polymerase sigma factor [Solirubrobacteraceae bacterium]